MARKKTARFEAIQRSIAMSDKRSMRRRHLIYYLSVFDGKTDHLVGQLVDLTVEGLMLTSERFIEPKVCYNLRMVLPEEIRGRTQLFFEAETVWCRKDINPNFYDIGFRLIKISKTDIKVIESLIYDFSFLDFQG